MATALSAGDLAIVNYNTDDPDSFAFVLLKGIEAGTQINFTDNGWKAAGGFLPGEGTATYTAATDIAAGTVVTMSGAALANIAFNVDGDQIIAYQGTAATPTLLYAADFADSNTTFAADATSTTTSALPTGLTLGTSAAAFGQDNGTYTGTTSGTRAQLQAAIANPANWTLSNTTQQTPPAGPFALAPAVAQDDLDSMFENGVLSGNVTLDNGDGPDTDPDGDALVVTAINGVAGDIGTEITLASGALVTLNADGTFVYDTNGKFDYVPANTSGGLIVSPVDTFTYTLDGGDTATVSVVIVGVDSEGDEVEGDGGANTLNGGIGADTMTGFGGNDTYRVDNANDVVQEAAGEGADTVIASVSYSLSATAEVETLETSNASGTTAINLAGNSFAQTIEGNAGSNILNDGGFGAADTLTGHGGDDSYAVYNAGATIVELAGEGNDRVGAGVNYVLANGVSAEYLNTSALLATYAVNLTGNELVQLVRGNEGTNTLDGGGGNDVLFGMGGADSFRFSTALGAANVDRIADFLAGTDTIQLDNAIFTTLSALGALDADAFKDTASGPKDADDRIIYNSDSGALSYDADGSGTAFGNVRFATITGSPVLTAADFVVV